MYDELALDVAIGDSLGNDRDRCWSCRIGDHGHRFYELLMLV